MRFNNRSQTVPRFCENFLQSELCKKSNGHVDKLLKFQKTVPYTDESKFVLFNIQYQLEYGVVKIEKVLQNWHTLETVEHGEGTLFLVIW